MLQGYRTWAWNYSSRNWAKTPRQIVRCRMRPDQKWIQGLIQEAYLQCSSRSLETEQFWFMSKSKLFNPLAHDYDAERSKSRSEISSPTACRARKGLWLEVGCPWKLILFYNFRFPACFFALYEFAKEVDANDPLNCMTRIGLQERGKIFQDFFNSSNFPTPNKLTGAFEEFHKMQNPAYHPADKHKIFRNLVNRHYWDPPEMQILLTNVKDRSHLGYWRDHPDELPPFIVRNDGYQGT